jgi:hypothetical protein
MLFASSAACLILFKLFRGNIVKVMGVVGLTNDSQFKLLKCDKPVILLQNLYLKGPCIIANT